MASSSECHRTLTRATLHPVQSSHRAKFTSCHSSHRAPSPSILSTRAIPNRPSGSPPRPRQRTATEASVFLVAYKTAVCQPNQRYPIGLPAGKAIGKTRGKTWGKTLGRWLAFAGLPPWPPRFAPSRISQLRQTIIWAIFPKWSRIARACVHHPKIDNLSRCQFFVRNRHDRESSTN